MTQERLSVRRIREVLRLKFEGGLSHRAIARSCAICHSTVREYVHRAQAAGLAWPLSETLDEDQLYQLLFPKPTPSSDRALQQPEWGSIHRELRRKGVTLRLLWLEYRETHPDGYGYSRFCELYRLWAKKLDPPMRLTHKAGERLFVDYAGQTVPVIDPETGEIRQAHIFVATLGASNYTYVEAQWAEDLPNWIGGHVRAFAFLGGVPEIVVPDNPKTGVKHPSHYEPDLNPTYQDMAEHYGTVIIPARVRKPRDKAKVEVGVQVVERWILARLRHRTFYGLAELNRAIRELLDELNDRLMRHLGQSRRQLFEALDHPALSLLPAESYELAVWKKAKVNIDYHVEFAKHYYSVPHRLIQQEVFIRATEQTVEIFHKRRRVASHPRSRLLGRYSTQTEHMPPAHRFYAEWSPDRFLRWAEKIGPQTRALIEAALVSRRHPQQAYRTCLGILGLAKRYSEERLEAACARALPAGIRSYKGVNNVLEACLDQMPLEEPASPARLDSHANIRGPSYYN
jgi:transposase